MNLRFRTHSIYLTLLSALLVSGLCLPSGARAQKKPQPVFRFRQETIYPKQTAGEWLDSAARHGLLTSPVQAVINLNGTPNREQLAAQGIYLKECLSGNNWTAIIRKPSGKNGNAAGMNYIVPVSADWKITTSGRQVAKTGQTGKWMVSCFRDIDAPAFEARVRELGGTIVGTTLAQNGFYEIQLSYGKLRELAQWYGVRTISASGADTPLNLEAGTATKASFAHLDAISGGYGLLGDSIAIGVGDNTTGIYNIDNRDRIINYNPEPYTNHGIHVTGTVMAAGTMDRRGTGIAPHATVINNTNRLIWANTGAMKQQHNMSVTNNSYTLMVGDCGNAGTYDANSQALDTLALQYPDILHVFAAGNDGSISCTPFPAGFATITGNYQPAKNILTVAQCDKMFQWGINSSKGPVRDGRLKPEITAIGTGVISTRNNDIYLTSGGTSMASPQVAGGAGLLQQQYKRTHGNAYPPADLVKALLMNGATDIGNAGPDFTFGFGVMNLKRSLDMMSTGHYTRNTITTGAQQTITITPPANTAQLKVMLYWHDVPASVLATRQLVNDLDLEVISGTDTVRPLILNPAPASVTALAQPGRDSINNVEQVVIDLPSASTYIIRVKGRAVPAGPQDYSVVYDYIPKGVTLTYPTTGANVTAASNLKIYWDASNDTGRFTLQFSDNNGSTWTTIDANIPAAQRTYQWTTPNINSEQCLMRLSRNGMADVSTTGAFVTNVPPAIAFDAVQCPGYISVRWPATPNATGYQVLRKKGAFLEPEAMITDTAYVFKNLSPDSAYYVAVRPYINGVPGYRSQAIKRIPNNGTCTGAYSNGDLMIERLESPVSGRLYTSSQLGANTRLTVRVRNLDDVATTNFRISYSLNNGSWQSQNIPKVIAGAGSDTVTLNTGMNLSAAGTYDLRVAVTNLASTDNNAGNDSLRSRIRQLENSPVDIYTGFSDGFEATSALAVSHDTLGFSPDQHWDFTNSTDTGLMRTSVNPDITITGNRSISLSTFQFSPTPITNTLTGTFNTAAYNVHTDELRLEFDYKLHGRTHFADSNRVWVRAADSLAWTPVYCYNADIAPGTVVNSGSISIADALIAAGKNYSAGMQIRFGQQDSTVISLNNYGAGLTIDNVKLYAVQQDVMIDSILSPTGVTCELNNTPVSVRVRNGVSSTINNILVSYQIDNWPVMTDTIESLAGKSSVTHTFNHFISGVTAGVHTIRAWAKAAGDTYTANDTMEHEIRNEPLISTFPYLENFESNDGYWHVDGVNSSWQYGTPASTHVTQAASGTKVWKTNLTGNYNDMELSYLYSPCFNVSGLSNPMLSFSAVIEAENCGYVMCDGVWVEYSTDDGDTWTKLGTYGQGQNWYSSASTNVWQEEDNYRWRVASIPLPAVSQTLRLRFVMSSDPGVSKEGITLDDVHIYDRAYPLYTGSGAGPVSATVSGSSLVNFTSGNMLVAQINPSGQNLGTTAVTAYDQGTVLNNGQHYLLPRSFRVSPAAQPTDSVTARFFVPDASVTALSGATGCGACTHPSDVYRLGIARYHGASGTENGSLTDDTAGSWTFTPYNRVKWVPYDKGYYAEVRLPAFSEIWFSDGLTSQPLPLQLTSFNLEKRSHAALLKWELEQPEGGERISLERSSDGRRFTSIYETLAEAQPVLNQSYTDAKPFAGINYYRLAITANNGMTAYSQTLTAVFSDGRLSVYPNPARNNVHMEWAGQQPGTAVKLYDMMGSRVYMDDGLSGTSADIAVDKLPAGVYMLEFSQGQQIIHNQLQIVH